MADLSAAIAASREAVAEVDRLGKTRQKSAWMNAIAVSSMRHRDLLAALDAVKAKHDEDMRDAKRLYGILDQPAAVPAGYAEMRDALAFIERGILEGSIKCKPYIDFDPNATSLEPKSVLDLVRAALANNKENGNG